MADMKRRSSLTSLAAAVVAGALIGAGGGAGTYAAFSSGSTKTVVRQVPVNDSQPAANTSGLSVNAPSNILYPRTLGDSGKVQVGDNVVAIGAPFGLAETVTAGIISALHRQMTSPNNFTIADSIQTDAAINHGNSGGPLLNAQAQVIGVNAQIESDSGGSDGVGFAVPSDTIRSVASQLI